MRVGMKIQYLRPTQLTTKDRERDLALLQPLRAPGAEHVEAKLAKVDEVFLCRNQAGEIGLRRGGGD